MNQPVDQQVDGLIRFRLDLGYDGTLYAGWAKQPRLVTVQSELLKALTTIFGESKDDFAMRVAGRTDAGVHALGQVAHIDLSKAQLRRIGRGKPLAVRLNSLLPDGIRVYSIAEAPGGFDARFSATHRRYRYRIGDAKAFISPLEARFTLWLGFALDTDAMQRAADNLIGLHDFASFCKAREGATTIRELREITVGRNPDAVVTIELQADAFCHNMVRSIVGALISVGGGKAEPADVQRILGQKSRVGSFKVVAPHGLTLLEIGYPKDDELAGQAEKARNMRSLDEN